MYVQYITITVNAMAQQMCEVMYWRSVSDCMTDGVLGSVEYAKLFRGLAVGILSRVSLDTLYTRTY